MASAGGLRPVNPFGPRIHLPAMLEQYLSNTQIENGPVLDSTPTHEDSALLDAYSRAVVAAAEKDHGGPVLSPQREPVDADRRPRSWRIGF